MKVSKFMEIYQLNNRKGYSLRFCDMEEANMFLKFIEDYPDSTGYLQRVARKMRSSLSDKHADDVNRYSIPLWFEDVPDLLDALWIAYAYWDQTDFGKRAENAIEHDDKLRTKRKSEHLFSNDN